jgi:regulator of protease activity HflC (stomatin/prohibitin superfamily)
MAKITQTTNTDNTLDKGIDKSMIEKMEAKFEERMAKLEAENEKLRRANVSEQIKESKKIYD